MARWGFALLALVAFAACASAARAPFLQDRLEVQEGQSNFGAFWKDVMRRGRGKERLEDEPAYVSIRFMVPPSEATKFEDAWLKCEREALNEEKGLETYSLHRALDDNTFFFLYGEWQYLTDFLDHVESGHFQDFTEFVDKVGIRWQLESLENMSMDVEEKQGLHSGHRHSRLAVGNEDASLGHSKKSGESDWDKNIPKEYRKYIPERYLPREGRKEMKYEVLFTYLVPTDLKKSFESDWVDTAFSTIEEEGNTALILRKTKTDNTRYYAFGIWDSIHDFLDSYHSRHVGKLAESLADDDIRVLLTPMERVMSHKKE